MFSNLVFSCYLFWYPKVQDQINTNNKRTMGIIRSCWFLRIFTYTDDGLIYVRLGYVRVKECLAELENWHRRVRAPCRWYRNWRKANVKIFWFPHIPDLIFTYFYVFLPRVFHMYVLILAVKLFSNLFYPTFLILFLHIWIGQSKMKAVRFFLVWNWLFLSLIYAF